MTTRIPFQVACYLDAADRDDHDAAYACFTPEAVVLDDGRTYAGEAIRGWIAHAASEYEYTRDFRGLDPVDARSFVARYHLEGNFPGGVVDLRYVFTITADGRIERLEITV